MNSYKTLIRNVSDLMADRGWSQSELARRMEKRRPWVNNFLNGKAIPGLDVLDEFARVFKVTPRRLMRAVEKSRISA